MSAWTTKKLLNPNSVLGQVSVNVGPPNKCVQFFTAIISPKIYSDPIYGFLQSYPEWNVWDRQAQKFAKSEFRDRIASGDFDP